MTKEETVEMERQLEKTQNELVEAKAWNEKWSEQVSRMTQKTLDFEEMKINIDQVREKLGDALRRKERLESDFRKQVYELRDAKQLALEGRAHLDEIKFLRELHRDMVMNSHAVRAKD